MQIRATLTLFGLMATGLFGQPVSQEGAAAPSTSGSAAVPALIVVPVNRDGFVTRAFTLKAGIYHVMILNRTGVPNLNFQFQQLAAPVGASPAQIQTVMESGPAAGAASHLSKTMQLTPGSYRITIPDRPSWICAFQVQ